MGHATDVANAFAPPDSPSVETLVQRCLPSLERWAHSKLPRAARGGVDTTDLVQEAALRMLKRGPRFQARHPEAVRAYMRQTVRNLIRDEMRRLACRPELVEIREELRCDRAGPLEFTIGQELRARYHAALSGLRLKDRRLLVARVEQGRSVNEIANAFGLPSPAAAHMAITRALNRLADRLNHLSLPGATTARFKTVTD